MSAADGWIDFIEFARDVNTGERVAIVILDTNNDIAQELDSAGAREVASRLVTLADEWEREIARSRLRRLPDVDERLRENDG